MQALEKSILPASWNYKMKNILRECDCGYEAALAKAKQGGK